MKRSITIILIFLFTFCNVVFCKTKGVFETKKNILKNNYNYWIYTPFDYEQGGYPMPLVIFLHGASLCGNNINKVRKYGVLDAIEKGKVIPTLVLAPQNKVKGRVVIEKNIHKNLTKGRLYDNVCCYQVYDIDSPENRILKKALKFSKKQISVYKNALDVSSLEQKAAFIKPYFENVGNEIDTKYIKTFKYNPVFKEYNIALKFAQLLLRRFSYDITTLGEHEIKTPPFWIDMSKLFELYVFSKLRQVFTEKNEVIYHVKAHYQELDNLLNPTEWESPYIIDAKYKPQYKESNGIYKDDAREVSGYSQLNSIYQKLDMNEDTSPPIKCLIIYPDQEQGEKFAFTRRNEPTFDDVAGYMRIYKTGIRLPVIRNSNIK